MSLTVVTPIAPEHREIFQKCHESVAAQTVPTEHLFVVDEERRGPGAIRNALLRQVTTPMVTFLDADDWLEPTFAETLIPLMRSAHYVYSDWYLAGRVHRPPANPWCNGAHHLVTAIIWTADALNIGFDESLDGMEDTDFYIRLLASNTCGIHVPKALVHYRPGGGRSKAIHEDGRIQKLKQLVADRYRDLQMGCCGGGGPVIRAPVGARQPNDVLCQARWRGNRKEFGKATGRQYPRMSWPRTAWVDPRDARAAPNLWTPIQLPEAPPQEGTLEDDDGNGYGGVRALANFMRDVGVVRSLAERPAKHAADFQQIITLGQKGREDRPLITICCGTINRLPLLQKMVQSVRDSIPRGFAYDFSIADNGSEDGTWDWLQRQPDVTAIQLGRAVGGIRALTTAASTAKGKHVLVLNDDCEAIGDNILHSFGYLEQRPQIGAIAWENRRNPGGVWGTQTVNATLPNGKVIRVFYIQQGLVRQWLGNLANWWGADEGMAEAWTYGGDNWLSSRIWEMGYSIVVVPGIRHADPMPTDAVRKYGESRHAADAKIYYSHYPGFEGPHIPDAPTVENPDSEALRIIYSASLDPNNKNHQEQKRGFLDALAERAAVIEVPYIEMVTNQGKQAWANRMCELVVKFAPHLIITQIHRQSYVDVDMVRAIRAADPGVGWVNFNYDYWPEHYLEFGGIELCKAIDLQLVSNAGAISLLAANGIRAAYLPMAYEDPPGELPDAPHWDILFLGNYYDIAGHVRFDTSIYPHCPVSPRRQLYNILRSFEDKYSVGIYGSGWPKQETHNIYHFLEGAALYANCGLTVNDMQFDDTYAYTSNRFFQALAAGAFLLQQHSPGLDKETGYRAGRHYVEWKDFDDLEKKIAYYLKHPRERTKIAEQGRRYTRRNHNWRVRVDDLFNKTLPKVFKREVLGT